MMMNRLFHARIVAGQYIALGLMTFITVWGFWHKELLSAVLFMLLLVVCIEKLIHTTYTLTSDGRLLLYRGRFMRSKEILIKEIVLVEQTSSMKIGRWAVMHYVLVRHGAGRCEVVTPVNEEAFIRALKKRMQAETNV